MCVMVIDDKKHSKRPSAVSNDNRMKRTFPIGLVLAAWTCPLVTERLAAAEGDWSFDVAPYLWVANVDLQTSLPTSPTSPAEVDRFATRISAGAMLAAEARYQSVGLFVDFAWLRLNTEAIEPGPAYSAVNLQSDFIHSTTALTYRLPLEGKFHAEILAGARLWYVANDFNATDGVLPGFNRSDYKTWVDPMVGGNVSYDFTKKWSADIKGMVGGFGVSATIAVDAFAGVSYRFNDWCSATLGYRYLYEQYDHQAFTFNLDTQGFLLGVGFHF